MVALVEAILAQIFEVVFLGLGYYTGVILVRIMSLDRLQVDYKKDEPLEFYGSAKAEGWHITYIESGKRYVVDWFVLMLGIFFWICLIVVIFEMVLS